MLKIIVGVARKVGLPNYSSLGANCTIESEADSTLLADPERLHQKMQTAYAAAWEAVEEQLQQRSPPTPPDPSGGQPPEATLTGQPATPRQIEYAHKLADQITDMGSAQLSSFTQDVLGKSLQALSCTEASRLIDLLKQIRAGKASGHFAPYADVA
jgi:hypothetical protein